MAEEQPQRLSVFDIFKIGIGPSSSHTMGPWKAAGRFLNELPDNALIDARRVTVELFGSLAKTGKGHGTDLAVQLGLLGTEPDTIPPETIQSSIESIAETRSLDLLGRTKITFDPKLDVVFRMDACLDQHPNGMRFHLETIHGETYCGEFYSVGGGFVVGGDDSNQPQESGPQLPFPIDSAEQLLKHCELNQQSIAGVVLSNELAWRSENAIEVGILRIADTMEGCVIQGCMNRGVLPGGLGVHRRAADAATRLLRSLDASKELRVDAKLFDRLRHSTLEFAGVLDWISCFALAVNEENAAFGRVVTAPTNGAAGVIPAVFLYLTCFSSCRGEPREALAKKFLLVAGEIGCLFKKNATISAALGGCQAEIGVSSAMAAAGLAECLGGTPAQACEAAEIAMEHHLGLTCDPIGGLVQVPCIERNAMGAIKAITAAQMAVAGDPALARVSLDEVIKTMLATALDMNNKYKETSEGGLAAQIAVNLSEC